MKKLLSILSISGIVGLSSSNVVSCDANAVKENLSTKTFNQINASTTQDAYNNIRTTIASWAANKIDGNNIKNDIHIGITLYNKDISKKIEENKDKITTGTYKLKINIDNNDTYFNEMKPKVFNINIVHNYNPLLATSDAIFGNENDFTLIMENDDFAIFAVDMKTNNNHNEFKTTNDLEKLLPNATTIVKGIDDKTWNNIFSDFYATNNSASVANGYIGILHIESNKFNYSNTTEYTNNFITNIKTVDMHPQGEKDKLITAAIPFTKDELTTRKSVLINKELLEILNNYFTNNQLTIANIDSILTNSNFQFSNNDKTTIENCLLNLFKNNYDVVTKELVDANINNGIVLNFDKNNNYLSTN